MRIEYVFPEGKNKILTFSYDDGCLCDERLADIFASTDMKATFNLNSGRAGKKGYIPLDRIKSVFIDRGMEVACHGETHPFEEKLLPASLLQDVLNDRKALEEATGTVIRGMAYAYGTWSDEVLNVLKAVGIAYCRTIDANHQTFYMPQSREWLTWNPTCHHKENILPFAQAFAANAYPGMMYVWGHGFEFDMNNNWNVIEEFCDKMKNLPNFWYATNIQIHDYIEACRRLITNWNGQIIYNPSAIPVFIRANDKVYGIDPGQTVEIK